MVLSRLMQDLFTSQCRDWPELAQNHAGLEEVKVRSLSCGGYEIALQCNPKRIRSTAAPIVDGQRFDRHCFLCIDRLPDLQAGILYRDRYLILCNPMPILTGIYDFQHRHIPQSLDGSLQDLLLLSRGSWPDYVVFLQWARCGASLGSSAF